MRIEELIIYKNFVDEEILQDMVYLMEYYRDGEEGNRELFYDCMNKLLEFSASHGFYGNLWHTFLTNLLVNHENSYSMACEVKGSIEGTINQMVLHDIRIFKELYDYDFTDMIKELRVPEFAMLLSYESSSKQSKVYNTRIRDTVHCRQLPPLVRHTHPQGGMVLPIGEGADKVPQQSDQNRRKRYDAGILPFAVS